MKFYPGKIRKNASAVGKISIFMMGFLLIFAVNCSKTDIRPQYNPPPDHTVNNDGVLHKSGLKDPFTNCVGCHGADLKGGSAPVSCYECHGVMW
jgi:hypothetical protein